LRNVAEAEKRLADLRNKAADPNEVMNAEFGLEKSKLDVEEATLAVSDAEEALAKTLADPDASPRDKRKAELALVSAKFALRDSIISAGEAEREVIATRATGATAEELAEAERALDFAEAQAFLDAQGTVADRQALAKLEAADARFDRDICRAKVNRVRTKLKMLEGEIMANATMSKIMQAEMKL
jgi:hypothetical protein